MDLLTYWRVLQRRKAIVIVGFAITLALTFLAVFRVSPSGIELRTPPVYVAESNLLVTQSGFPWGRGALTEYLRAQGAGDADTAVPRFADPTRMEYLANLYSQLTSSDDVRRIIRRNGFRLRQDDEEYAAVPVTTPDGRQLPLIEITATSPSRARAVVITNRAAKALRTYVSVRQQASRIPDETKIELPVITRAEKAKVFRGVKLTTAVMVAILGILGTLFVAFVVDNVKRQRAFAEEIDDVVPEPEALVPRLAQSSDQAAEAAQAAPQTTRSRQRR